MTTYAAHIFAPAAHAFSDPSITVMEIDDGQEQLVVDYELSAYWDISELHDTLHDIGWGATSERTQTATGYYTVAVEIRDYKTVLQHLTLQKKSEELQLMRTTSALTSIVYAALDAGMPVSKIATATAVSPQRIYQIRDARLKGD